MKRVKRVSPLLKDLLARSVQDQLNSPLHTINQMYGTAPVPKALRPKKEKTK